VVAWATEALDEVRRAVWNEARRANRRDQAVALKGARWALWKNGDNLSESQRSKLAWVQRVNQPLYQAYLIKEHLRLIFQLPFDHAIDLLIEWLQWAFDSPLEPIVRLACRIADHLDELLNTLRHNLSQRPRRGPEHAHPPDRQARLRLPLRRGADRSGHARSGGLPALPSRSSGRRHRLTRPGRQRCRRQHWTNRPTFHPC
jgi:transposase